MLTFSEYLKEMRLRKKLEEDVLLNGNEVGSTNNANGSIFPVTSTNIDNSLDILSKSTIPTTDYSVLGKADIEKNGFMSKDDFFLPTSVLSNDNRKSNVKPTKKKKNRPY